MAEPLVAVLAAGRGTRFGGGKLEALCAGKPLGRWVVDAVEAAALGPGVIVTGPQGVTFAEGWMHAINPRPEDGLASSLAVAARAALDRDAQTLLVLLADMPLVTPGYLRVLAGAKAPAATRQPEGRPGVPALLDRELIEWATRLTGPRGATGLLRTALQLDPPPGMLRDVDTSEDLAEIERLLSR